MCDARLYEDMPEAPRLRHATAVTPRRAASEAGRMPRGIRHGDAPICRQPRTYKRREATGAR